MYRIDKTEGIKNRLMQYPSIYIEGAAASGKTVAAEMYIAAHPELRPEHIDLDDRIDQSALGEKLCKLLASADQVILVADNIPSQMDPAIEKLLCSFVRKMPSTHRVIFISQEEPSPAFLDLLWKGQMDILPQRELLLSLRDIQKLISKHGSHLQAKNLHKITGGWPGCVDLMIRMAKSARANNNNNELTKITAASLREKYEIDKYINTKVLQYLTKQEQDLLSRAMYCPWISLELCQDYWQIPQTEELLTSLERKGLLNRHSLTGRLQVAPMLQRIHEPDFPWRMLSVKKARTLKDQSDLTGLSNWYESQGCLREAFWCEEHYGTQADYFDKLLTHYKEIPFTGISYMGVIHLVDARPEYDYLRGMWYRRIGDYEKMNEVIKRIGKGNPELYLNLTFANPEISLDDWLADVELLTKRRERAGIKDKFQLYDMLGYNYTYLCGVRDLTGLFSCERKVEKSRAALWKRAFGQTEWTAYCMARADYYIETDRVKSLTDEDRLVVASYGLEATRSQINTSNWKLALAALYLMCRMESTSEEPGRTERIHQLREALLSTGDVLCSNNTEAIISLYGQLLGCPEQMNRWLLSTEGRAYTDLTSTEMMCLIKCYLSQQQYGKADIPIQRMLTYLGKYHMNYFYTEALYQSALVSWQQELHGQALKNVIECFVMSGSHRYVLMYTGYGKCGVEVVKSYIEWMHSNASGSWNTKKKYNYGNVLRMPVEDYMDVILRKAKKSTPKEKPSKETQAAERAERLTMMETIILQDISRGLTNADICEEQNLKLSTVKTHLYALYKKLGVRNRVEATLKGKELGIVK